MLDEEYLASRAVPICPDDMGTASAGMPPGEFDPTAPDSSAETGGTSHISIVDRWGTRCR
jgi:gamma-glutamyltranspeptidase